MTLQYVKFVKLLSHIIFNLQPSKQTVIHNNDVDVWFSFYLHFFVKPFLLNIFIHIFFSQKNEVPIIDEDLMLLLTFCLSTLLINVGQPLS